MPGFLVVDRPELLACLPRDPECEVVLVFEDGLDPGVLLLVEQVGSLQEDSPDPIERIVLPAPPPGLLSLQAPAAVAHGFRAELDHVEGVEDLDHIGDLLGGGSLEPHEPIHRDVLDPLAPGRVSALQLGVEHLLRPSREHVQQPCGPGLVLDGGEVDDHGHVLLALGGVSPYVLVDADHGDVVEPAGVVDQSAFALGEDRRVRRGPGQLQVVGDRGDGPVVDH